MTFPSAGTTDSRCTVSGCERSFADIEERNLHSEKCHGVGFPTHEEEEILSLLHHGDPPGWTAGRQRAGGDTGEKERSCEDLHRAGEENWMVGHRKQRLRVGDYIYYRSETVTRGAGEGSPLTTTTRARTAVLVGLDHRRNMAYIRLAEEPGGCEWVQPRLLTIRPVLLETETTEDPWK